MAELNLQAEQLNKTIQSCDPAVYELLSKKGRAIFFPAKGILAQTAEAKGKTSTRPSAWRWKTTTVRCGFPPLPGS
jgi:hypothetical protein